MITFLVLFVPSIQKPLARLVQIFSSSKDIILFVFFIGVLFGVSIHVLFSRETDFFDGEGPFLGWNYTTLSKALYTGFQLNLDVGKAYGPMMLFFREDWGKFMIWFCILLAFKFLFPGFLIGALTGNY